jgi:hypothetical protein
MRIDNLSTNLYTSNTDSNNIDSSQQNQSQPLLDKSDTQEVDTAGKLKSKNQAAICLSA